VRDFAASDTPALAGVLDAASRIAFPWAHLPQTDEAAFVRRTDGEVILVAELDGEVSGFSSVWTEDLFLHHFHVAPRLHRCGIGHALMDATLARHGPVLSLKCAAQNLPARAFYRAMRWIETREPGGEDQDTGPWLWIRTPQAAKAIRT
jgi:ribosomal protein S18 acetylase RimI-like enzyme